MKEQFPHYNIEHLNDASNQKLNFEVFEFGSADVFKKALAKKSINAHHMHSFYSILWTDKGSCTQYVDGKPYKQEANSLLFICPGQIHINTPETTDNLSGGAVLFSPDFFTLLRNSNSSPLEFNFLDNFYANPLLNLSSEEFGIIKQTIHSIVSEKRHKSSEPLILQSLLLALIMQIQRYIDAELSISVPKQSINVYKEFTSVLEKNYKNNTSVEEYAAILNLSSRHLNRLIKETTGKSTSQIIKSRVMLEAKRLLLYTSLSISEISTTLGYLDDSYFNKVFKKETGLTPKGFRAEMSE